MTLSLSLVEAPLESVRHLFKDHHKYGGAGGTSTYCFAFMEGGSAVAAYVWQPPAPGAALAVCPEAPPGVLALSRMVAVPRAERALRHISKPLRLIMRDRIDRTRWPVLLTYSDAGAGHTGYVYECSGWQATSVSVVPFYVNDRGERVSSYSNGGKTREALTKGGTTILTRWEHWACERGTAAEHMARGGWERVLTGKRWRSGNPAATWVRRQQESPSAGVARSQETVPRS